MGVLRERAPEPRQQVRGGERIPLPLFFVPNGPEVANLLRERLLILGWGRDGLEQDPEALPSLGHLPLERLDLRIHQVRPGLALCGG